MLKKGMGFVAWLLLVVAVFAYFGVNRSPTMGQAAVGVGATAVITRAVEATILPIANSATPTSLPITPAPTEESILDALEPNQPITDTALIEQIVTGFAQKQEAFFGKQAGWLLFESKQYLSDASLKAGITMMAPGNEATFQNWYAVNESGMYAQGLNLTLDAAGTVWQESVLVGDWWVNLTLAQSDLEHRSLWTLVTNHELLWPTTEAAQLMSQDIDWGHTMMEAVLLDNGEFVVTAVEVFDPPAENVIGLSETAVKAKSVTAFNALTGSLLFVESYVLPQSEASSDGWVLQNRFTYLQPQFFEELPSEINERYVTAVQTAQALGGK